MAFGGLGPDLLLSPHQKPQESGSRGSATMQIFLEPKAPHEWELKSNCYAWHVTVMKWRLNTVTQLNAECGKPLQIRCIWHVWSCTLRLTFTMLQNTENAIAVWQSGLSSCVFQQNILHTNCTLWMDNDLNIQFLRDKVPMVVRCFGSKFLPMCDSLRGWVATLAYLFAWCAFLLLIIPSTSALNAKLVLMVWRMQTIKTKTQFCAICW